MTADIRVFEQDGQLWTTSREVADKFARNHKNVLRAIESTMADCPEDFNRLNFAPVEYTDVKGESRPMFFLSRGGFSLIAMGFTGKAAITWKVKFIAAFDAMEKRMIQPMAQSQMTQPMTRQMTRPMTQRGQLTQLSILLMTQQMTRPIIRKR